MTVQKLSSVLVLAAACVVRAGFPETVPVDMPGNAPDSTGYGAVKYEYRIGKFEVTVAEYAEFLNAVAKTDPHGLFEDRMPIKRVGAAEKFAYQPKPNMARKPIGFVSWLSAIRYVNWLTNGRGKTGTEIGTYIIEGNKVTPPDHAILAADKITRWALPTENEWYKAAYFDPKKPGGPGYWPYAVRGGNAPKSNINTNTMTDVGAFTMSPSPWSTYDQNGSVWEYNETVSGGKVGLRGGSYLHKDTENLQLATTRYEVENGKWPNYGFRVVALGTAGLTQAATRPPPVVIPSPGTPAAAKTDRVEPRIFHISSSTGNDEWTGEAGSPNGNAGPWKTFARAAVEYIPGDKILLKRGDTWNEELRPKGNGNAGKPITIGAYGEGPPPVIDRQDFRKDLTGIRLSDQEGYKITGIEFARCMTGIYSDFSGGSAHRKFLWIEDCYFHDSLHYQKYNDYPAHKIGLGISIFSHETKGSIVLSDVTIRNCVFRRMASGIWTNNLDSSNPRPGNIINFSNFTIEGCLFEEGGDWQLGLRSVDKGVVRNCVTHDVGRDFRSLSGAAGAMFSRCRNWVFEDCEWGFVSIGRKGAVSGNGVALNFESNCEQMVMRNCLFHDTDGPGFLLSSSATGPEPHRTIVFENCVFNGKAARAVENRTPRTEILNATDLNDASWKNCRFYLAPGVGLYATLKISTPDRPLNNLKFVDCVIKDLSSAGRAQPLPAKTGYFSKFGRGEAAAGAWSATAEKGSWVVLDFGSPLPISEFKIKEDPSSTVNRYVIEFWDEGKSDWVGCFNGAAIGGEFIAPIVSRTTRKARLAILRATAGEPKIVSFEAYGDAPGEIFNETAGGKPTTRTGK